MSSTPTLSSPRPARVWAAALGVIVTAALVACGGGGGGAESSGGTTPPVTATGSFTSGAISGFGSIIVNGVRFDDSGAQVYDDDGNRRGSDDLKLGAHVEIEASRIDRTGGSGTATVIRYGSEIVGPVTAVNSAASTFTLLGQTVETTSTTVFDDSLAGGLSALTAGLVVEIHAQWDAARSVYVASRIEDKLNATSYKLRGTVANLDTTARTFSIGGAVLNYGTATTVPTTLANGAWVRVNLQTTPSNGQWVVSNFGNESRSRGDHSEAEIKGIITAWTSATQFSVDGLAVDATKATFREGTAGVVLGAQVEVEGAIVNGVMVATKVHLEDDSSRGRGEDYELHGTVSALNTTAKTFSLRGLTVNYSATTWKDGSESQLANGSRVEVKGDLSSDGATLTASRIDFE